MDDKIALTYDDVALIPQYSEIESRSHCDISVELKTPKKTEKLRIPLIGAPMDTICEAEMCIALWEEGAIGILHRYITIDEQVEMLQRVVADDATCFAAIGVTGDYLDRATVLYNNGARHFCIDVAHGSHIFVKKAITALRHSYKNIHIMAGNVCDYDGAFRCFKWGADSIRVGVGGGAVCTTRLVTGHGVPNLTAIELARKAKEDYQELENRDCYIVADGGIRTSGDAAKAFAFGADYVMVGSMLSGCEETPSVVQYRGFLDQLDASTVEQQPQKQVVYRGMASQPAQNANGRVSVVEGVEVKVDMKGPVTGVLLTFRDGLRSALSYTGATNLSDFKKTARYIRVSPAAQIESQPHAKFDNQ